MKALKIKNNMWNITINDNISFNTNADNLETNLFIHLTNAGAIVDEIKIKNIAKQIRQIKKGNRTIIYSG